MFLKGLTKIEGVIDNIYLYSLLYQDCKTTLSLLCPFKECTIKDQGIYYHPGRTVLSPDVLGLLYQVS